MTSPAQITPTDDQLALVAEHRDVLAATNFPGGLVHFTGVPLKDRWSAFRSGPGDVTRVDSAVAEQLIDAGLIRCAHYGDIEEYDATPLALAAAAQLGVSW